MRRPSAGRTGTGLLLSLVMGACSAAPPPVPPPPSPPPDPPASNAETPTPVEHSRPCSIAFAWSAVPEQPHEVSFTLEGKEQDRWSLVIPPAGQTLRLTHDDAGRIVAARYGDGPNATQWSYSSDRERTRTDIGQDGKPIDSVVESLREDGQIDRWTRADLTMVYRYDDEGRLTEVLDEKSDTRVTYTYGAKGRRDIEHNYPDADEFCEQTRESANVEHTGRFTQEVWTGCNIYFDDYAARYRYDGQQRVERVVFAFGRDDIPELVATFDYVCNAAPSTSMP